MRSVSRKWTQNIVHMSYVQYCVYVPPLNKQGSHLIKEQSSELNKYRGGESTDK